MVPPYSRNCHTSSIQSLHTLKTAKEHQIQGHTLTTKGKWSVSQGQRWCFLLPSSAFLSPSAHTRAPTGIMHNPQAFDCPDQGLDHLGGSIQPGVRAQGGRGLEDVLHRQRAGIWSLVLSALSLHQCRGEGGVRMEKKVWAALSPDLVIHLPLPHNRLGRRKLLPGLPSPGLRDGRTFQTQAGPVTAGTEHSTVSSITAYTGLPLHSRPSASFSWVSRRHLRPNLAKQDLILKLHSHPCSYSSKKCGDSGFPNPGRRL